MASKELVMSDKSGAVCVLTLNRPQARNAISDEMRLELQRALSEVSADPSVRVAILTGAGSAFCAGGDVRGMRARLDAPTGEVAINGWRRQQRTFRLIGDLYSLDKVTIAAVNGPAVGLGFDLALACDFVVSAQDAFFAATYIRRGLIADGGGMYLLPRRIGLQKAKQLLYSGRKVSADEGAALGFVEMVVEGGDLLTAARAFAQAFSGQPSAALALMKSIVNRSYELGITDVAALGSLAQAVCYTGSEHRMSIQEFLSSNQEPT